jgi:capsular polysaccharide transport system permease protein
MKTVFNNIFYLLGNRKRMIYALLLRESKTRFGTKKIGLLWALVEPLLQVAVFAAIYYVTNRSGPNGIPVIPFMIVGILCYFLFSKTFQKVMVGIESNTSLLNYPILKPIDVLLSRMVLEFIIYCVNFVLCLYFMYYFNLIDSIARIHLLLLAFFCSSFLGFCMGTLLASIIAFFPSFSRFTGVLNRALFLTSGLFFSASMIPQSGREIILWNPVLHLLEIARYGVFYDFPDDYFSINYILVTIFISFVISLMLIVLAEFHPNSKVRGSN